MNEILFDVKETLRQLTENPDISWSKYSDFSSCPTYWFTKYYLIPKDSEKSYYESSRAIPGVIIQKLFEVFINERVYHRSQMESYDHILEWFNTNTKALYYLLAFSVEDQYSIFNARHYFRTKIGKDRVQKMIEKYNLDPLFHKGIQPQFIDFEFFKQENGTPEKFFERLCSFYKPILDMFIQVELNLDLIQSEHYVKANFINNSTLSGKVDFIYNKYQQGTGYFYDIKNLKDKYVLMDGKFKISKYVKEEQLFFYATVIYLRHGKVPEYVVLIDWSKAQLVTHSFDINYITYLKERIINMLNFISPISIFITDLLKSENRYFDLFKIPTLTQTPSDGGCTFCPINQTCVQCIEKKVDFKEGIKSKRETEAILRETHQDDDKDIQDINL